MSSTRPSWPIRTISAEEFPAFARAVGTAFSESTSEEEIANERRLTELDRAFAAFDGPDIVGTAAVFTMPMAVPGGEIEVGYVTAVGVLPTHRRRGINTELMRRLHQDARERGELVEVLYASEAGIYGRYGYGLATLGLSLDVECARSAFVRGYEPSGSIELVDKDAAIKDLLAVHDAVRPTRPGMVALNQERFEYGLHEHEPDRAQPRFVALHEGADGVDGFAIYRVKEEWNAGVPGSVLTVRDLQATTPGSVADLWRFVLDVDLVERVRAWNRPVDDPLLHLVREPRRLRASIQDNLWLRLVDVAGALSARRYRAPGRIVLEVRDLFGPWNEGRYALDCDEGSIGSATRVRKAPEIACTVNDLAAAYLGGASFRQLWGAGRVQERSPGAVARADAMFGWDPAPWSPYVF